MKNHTCKVEIKDTKKGISIKLKKYRRDLKEFERFFIKLPIGKCEMCGKENVYILRGFCNDCLNRFNSKRLWEDDEK